MRKRLCAAVLAMVMTLGILTIPSGAADTTRFSDVSDRSTALAVETLRLMGVLDGYSDGTFRPNQQLTRAQFCKMAVYALGAENELGLYNTITVFPDVKPSHWAAGYINMAAKGKEIIAGYPDGRFYPDRTVTVGQAVTILLRLLGYKDDKIGGVWPDSYMAMASVAGLTEGMTVSGSAPLTRAQAARLFVNLLQADSAGEGGVEYTLSEETELLSVDGSTGQMKTTKETYTMAHPVASTSLVGAKGYVVSMNGKALTFLPLTSGNAGTASSAIVVYEDGSAAGFGALAGNNTYTIYKNGTLATVKDLRKHDVATYSSATNTIRVCDTRVTVYYEACTPNPSAPTKITVLGGTELSVLPSALDTLSKFKPGDQMTLLLTADGQVAGAVQSNGTNGARGNAVGVVSDSGTVQMFCGGTTVSLAGSADGAFNGQVVRISSTSSAGVSLSKLSGGLNGDLDVSGRKLGNRNLAENVMVFMDGSLINLSQLTSGSVPSGEITYARANWAGEVDLIVLRGSRDSTTIYGRVFWTVDDEDQDCIGVEYGNGDSGRTKAFHMRYNFQGGDYVAATINRGGTGFSSMVALNELANVSKSAWIEKSSVLVGGRSYTVPANVLCYNRDSNSWITLDAALDYADTANLYASSDGIIRAVEVRHSA
ncbi:S-layer homology domain-containing protein [Oscillibacter valericigenes]|nr:S-layer homology domain-containing protein [Oscillibacter sp.]MCQ5025425.1 S-layer homology domain-containing protein [Oscillibacter valericigenes]